MPAPPQRAVHGAQAAAKADDHQDRSQRGRETHLPQPCRGIEGEAVIPGAMLLGVFQRFLQPHARPGQKAGGRLFHRQSVHLRLKLLLIGKLGSTVFAALDVLLQLVPRVVGQLVIQVQADVMLYPIAIHKTTS